MFGLGLSELIIIAAIGLVVLGPEKFPEFAKIALRAFRDLRGYVDDIKREMAEELNPVKSELTKLAQLNAEDYIAPITQAFSEVEKEITEQVTATETDTSSAVPGAGTSSEESSSELDSAELSSAELGASEESDQSVVAGSAKEDIGSFSEGKRFPEPTPGGEGRPGPDEYPN